MFESKSDRVVIITGGGAGIGKACSLRFSKEGYKVVIGDFSESDGNATCKIIIDNGGEAVYCFGDVSREVDCHAFAKKALNKSISYG
ncbi:TPA: SDR family NAD(P)-dependent oxidoreductase [bacterium]|nr:SDR family NAD(P)-dependent oxidoreductase [bacterium]